MRRNLLAQAESENRDLWTDAGWRSIRTNSRLDEMAIAARRRIASEQVELPKVVAMHRKRNASAWYANAE